MAYSVKDHFANKEPEVKATYDAIVKAAKQLGSVKEEAKKTSIHLVRKSAFAGVATRRNGLILTLKSEVEVENSRIHRSEKASASRWYFEVRVDSPVAVDSELKAWLKQSYEISG